MCARVFGLLAFADDLTGSFYMLLLVASLGLKGTVSHRSGVFDHWIESLAFALRNPERKRLRVSGWRPYSYSVIR